MKGIFQGYEELAVYMLLSSPSSSSSSIHEVVKSSEVKLSEAK